MKVVFRQKNTSFYSEFNADSEYVILFQKYFEQKIGLIDTPALDPLSHASPTDYDRYTSENEVYYSSSIVFHILIQQGLR